MFSLEEGATALDYAFAVHEQLGLRALSARVNNDLDTNLLVRSEDDLDSGSRFFSKLYDAGALIQYILYSPAEVAWFVKLCQQGVLPGSKHFMLFVFGRYKPAALPVPGTCGQSHPRPGKRPALARLVHRSSREAMV